MNQTSISNHMTERSIPLISNNASSIREQPSVKVASHISSSTTTTVSMIRTSRTPSVRWVRPRGKECYQWLRYQSTILLRYRLTSTCLSEYFRQPTTIFISFSTLDLENATNNKYAYNIFRKHYVFAMFSLTFLESIFYQTPLRPSISRARQTTRSRKSYGVKSNYSQD